MGPAEVPQVPVPAAAPRQPATAPPPPAAAAPPAAPAPAAGPVPEPARVVDTLRDVYDPCCREKGISVVDMGLVRSVAIGPDRRARVELLLTSGWCPFATRVLTEVRDRVQALPGIAGAEVEIVWDEPWTTDRLSPSARRLLRFLPEPAAVPDRDAYLAAHWRPPAGTGAVPPDLRPAQSVKEER